MFLRFNSQSHKYILVFLLILFSNFISISQESKEAFISDSLRANNYLKKLQEHYKNGDYLLHKNYSDSLLLIAKSNGLTKMEILALTNQAVFSKNHGGKLKAIELYHKALKVCDLIPEDFRTKVIVLVNMGNIYNNIGSYDKSINHMEQVLLILDTNEDSDNIRAAALLGLANSHSELQDFEKSIAYASKVKVIGENINNNSITISSISSLIDSYNNSKDYKKALEYSEMIINSKILDKPTKSKAWILLNTGKANYYLNNLDQSLIYLLESLALSQDKKMLEIEMFSHEYLAKVYENKKEYKLSVKEQKEYTANRELFLKDEKDASNADLNQEINSKSELIEERNENLKAVSETNTIVLIALGALITMLVIAFTLHFNRKRRINKQQEKLRTQYSKLEQDFKDYKSESTTGLTDNTLKQNTDLKPYKNSSLTPEKREEYKNIILKYIKEDKPYLNPEMTQSNLASELNISSHHFSEVLYYNMEQNFYNFINSYRILEAQNLMKNPNYTDVKIIAIAFDSGFKSKTSFNRAFKNLTGLTPSEYKETI